VSIELDGVHLSMREQLGQCPRRDGLKGAGLHYKPNVREGLLQAHELGFNCGVLVERPLHRLGSVLAGAGPAVTTACQSSESTHMLEPLPSARSTLPCTVHKLPRNSDEFKSVSGAFLNCFGPDPDADGLLPPRVRAVYRLSNLRLYNRFLKARRAPGVREEVWRYLMPQPTTNIARICSEGVSLELDGSSDDGSEGGRVIRVAVSAYPGALAALMADEAQSAPPNSSRTELYALYCRVLRPAPQAAPRSHPLLMPFSPYGLGLGMAEVRQEDHIHPEYVIQFTSRLPAQRHTVYQRATQQQQTVPDPPPPCAMATIIFLAVILFILTVLLRFAPRLD
jgi:hypothetical protein